MKVLGRARINLVALQTLTTEVEAVLNDRPLTYVTSAVTVFHERNRVKKKCEESSVEITTI